MQYVGQQQEYAINTSKVIGKGNYGQVYECYYQGSLQPLCAKVLTIYKDNKSKVQEKDMDREKQITEIIKKNQSNPNLVKIHYVEHDKVKSYLIIIMEKCISSLQQEWNEKKIYQDFEIFDFIKQFVNGYKALFDANIIHRDIKPENILIQQIGQQKFYRLADFGVGRIYKLNDFKLTKIGTPAFASPELNSLIMDDELDHKFSTMKKQKSVVDIYSLGIILHMMITGGYPFSLDQAGIIKFIKEIKTTPFKFQSCFNSRFTQLVESMIIYDPTKRLTFQQFLEEINRLTIPPFPKFQSLNPQNISQNLQNTPQNRPFNQTQNQFSQQVQSKPFPVQNLQVQQFQQQASPINMPNIIQMQINVQDEICNYFRKFLNMHRKILNQQHIETISKFLLGNYQLINEIGKLYDNFDRNSAYSDEDVNFYYCLKYAQKSVLQVAKKSKQEQIQDLQQIVSKCNDIKYLGFNLNKQKLNFSIKQTPQNQNFLSKSSKELNECLKRLGMTRIDLSIITQIYHIWLHYLLFMRITLL
ncbi:unnamed protein product [Paramecium sonneborni]|uniref:Protein kinase domain-containing protein n=1 Tax=Paramecium sonneborni TaxID=65129 RepID=A0A8S1LI74_9CILI|nr:unnamed protein product [Paramecium sonneborni]